MPRGSYMQFDETISSLSDNAFRVLCYLRHHDGKSGVVWPSIETVAEDLKRSIRTCKYAIAELKESGLLQVEKDSRGRWVYRLSGAKYCTAKVQNFAQASAKVGAMYSATFSAENCIPPKNPHIGELNELNEVSEGGGSESARKESKPEPPAATTTGAESLEPFEAGNPAPLPAVRNAAEPFRPRLVELRPTQFKPETRDKILTVLGTEGDQFARKVTQEQADAGFPDWILDEAKKNRTPVKLAFHLLKTAWREDWISPKAEEETKRAARRARLEALRERCK